MSVLTLLGYYMADMIVGQQKAISGSESRIESIEIFRQVQILLADKASCEKTLTGDSTASPAIPAVRLDLTKDSSGNYNIIAIADANQAIRDKAGNIIFKKGETYGNGAIELKNIAVRNESLEIKSGATTGSGTALLQLSTERLKGNLKGRTITRNFLLQVVADNSGNITECFADIDAITSTAALEATKQVLKMNKCDYDADAETVSCAGDASMDCKIEQNCVEGTSISTTKSGKHVCCQSTALTLKSTCDQMGGEYKPGTCPQGQYSPVQHPKKYTIDLRFTQRFPQCKAESLTDIQTQKNKCKNLHKNYCPGFATIKTKKCKAGYAATNIQWPRGSQLIKKSVRTSDARGYKSQGCNGGYRFQNETGIISDPRYVVECVESTCAERCELNTNTSLMSGAKAAACETLGYAYDYDLKQCEVSGSNSPNTLTCRDSATPCHENELSIRKSEMWRVCMVVRSSENINSILSKQPNNNLLGVLTQMYKCPGLDPNKCPYPVATKQYIKKLVCKYGGIYSPNKVGKLLKEGDLGAVTDRCQNTQKWAVGVTQFNPTYVDCDPKKWGFDPITGIHSSTNKRYVNKTLHTKNIYLLLYDFITTSKNTPYRCCQ